LLATRLYWTAYLARHLAPQARYAFRRPAAIRRDQCRRVRSIVAYAARHVPHYRETMKRLGLTPADFRTADDLAKLPILERRDLARDPERLVARNVPERRRHWFRTGGSTGKSVQVAHDPAALLHFTAFYERQRGIVARAAGRRWGYREAVIASPDSTAATVGRICRSLTIRPGFARVRRRYFDLTADPADAFPSIARFQPHALFGTGSAIGRLLAQALASGRPFPPVKAVAYNSDDLAPGARRFLAERVGAQVLSWYGCVECLSIAFECEQHRGLHINTDHCPVRIVDDAARPLPPGETGNVVISNLVTRATVLLNYRVGDLAAILPQPCTCGRSLPLMSFITGREDDRLVLPTGRTVHPQAPRTVVEHMPEVWEFQFVQPTPTHLRVAIVAAPGSDRAALAKAIAAGLDKVFGGALAVDVDFVDEIDRTSSGKYRCVASLLGRPAPPGSDCP